MTPRPRRPALVSVVIPAHNAGSTIDQQLGALAVQDYAGDWEVVVVDNGSTDDTAARARAWGERIGALQVVAPAVGAGSTASLARNTGAVAARGDLLVFCDADDVVTPGWLRALVGAADTSDMVTGAAELEALNDAGALDSVRWTLRQTSLRPELNFLPVAPGSSLAVWRSVFEAVGGWNESFLRGDDVELSWRVQLAGYRLTMAPDALFHYRLNATTRSLWAKMYRDGKSEVQLFRAFRRHGMPRTDTRSALRLWAGRLRHFPEILHPETRGWYVYVTARHLGRLVGSVRHATLYL